MTRASAVNRRYEATAAVLRDGVSVFVVSDPAGTRLDQCVRQVEMEVQSDGAELWSNLVGALKALRWRLAFRPQPLEFNERVSLAAATIESEATTLRPGLGPRGLALVDEAILASQEVAQSDPPVGTRLLETLLETGPGDCIVVTDGRSSRDELHAWLDPLGFRVYSPGMLTDAELLVDVAYVIGPPRWLRPSLVTAPPAPEVCFVVPSWAGHATLPTTPLAEYAEGAIRPAVRVFQFGGTSSVEELPGGLEDESLENFAPPPIWDQWGTDAREPDADEVPARKVLLSGDFAIWMDEGDRIRTLDPSQPPGERVTYTDVDAVQPGSYLLLRLGVTERAALFDETVRSMGSRGPIVSSTQQAWKGALLDRLRRDGRIEVQAQLRRLGVHAAVQVMAWTEPTLARPQKDADFTGVLEWLGIPHHPTFDHATEFRRARSRAASQIREQLEKAVSGANMASLQHDGHVTIASAGFADIFATRVLAISPSTKIVARHDARAPFRDRGGRWLG